MASPTKKAKYDPKMLEEAIEAVKTKKMGLRKASAHFGIPSSTLSDKVRGKSALVCVPRTLLTKVEEEKLVEWIAQMAGVDFGQSTSDIRAKAKAIMELHGSTETPMPSLSWVHRLIKRYPRLSLR